MRAITVEPLKPDTAQLEEFADPPRDPSKLRVHALALGVCGTDADIVSGAYGWAPPGHKRLILGHESLGEVIEAPDGSGFAKGDRVVGIVRHADPVPCPNCGVGEWDMCRNGQYTEHGIKEIDGFGSEYYLLDPDHCVKVDPKLGELGVLLEPTTVVAKAWEHITRIGERALWQPRSVLVTGAGPVGLLAAMMGRQKGLEVHVLDRMETGTKPDLVHALGATYHGGKVEDLDFEPDVIIECTGAPPVIAAVLDRSAAGGVVCLAGVSSAGKVDIDLGALNKRMVLGNEVIFGSVNANKRHYEAGAAALAAADPEWLKRLITRTVPLSRFAEALKRGPDDIKVVIDMRG